MNDLISKCRLEGRPVWRVGPYIAPRIIDIAFADPATGKSELRRSPAADLDHRPHLRQRVLLWLETGDPYAYELLQNHDGAEVNRLAAAVAHDLHGKDFEQVTQEMGYGEDCTTRRQVKIGRRLWRHLNAWPWCFWSDGKPPDDKEWQEQGADATLAAAFQTWAINEPVLPTY